jgi:hypothetical protein
MSVEIDAGAASAALALARRGWPLFPTKPNKAPRVLHGLRDATTNERAVTNWFKLFPDTGIAIRTGVESGLVVLDVDHRHGGDDTLAELEAKHGALPVTVECFTGGGGRHIYFAHPGVELRNSAGKVGPGLDMRGDGGYVIAPPSVHESGRRYEWSVDGHPDDVPVAEMPSWLFNLAVVRLASGSPNGNSGRPQRVSTATWVAMVRDGLPDGERNSGLTRIVGHLLAKDVDARLVLEIAHLINTRCRPSLPASEVDRIVNSICGCELRKRRAAR